MLASPAIQPSSALSVRSAKPDGAAADAPEGTQFQALLAQKAVPVAAVPDGQGDSAALEGELPAALTQAAKTGKILPPQLPLELPLTPGGEAEPLPAEAAPQPVKPVDLPIMALLGRQRAAALKSMAHEKHADSPPAGAEPEPVAQAEGTETAGPIAAIPEAAATQQVQIMQQTAAAIIAPAAAQADPAPAEAKPEPSARGNAAQVQLPEQAARLSQLRYQAPEAPAQLATHPRQITADERQPAASQRPPAQPPLTRVQLEIAPQAVRAAPAEAARPLLPLAASLAERTEAATTPVVPLAAPAAASPAAAPTMPAAPLAQPHDFSALVDRLAAAREAAQPQAISVSLPHADFGRVQLSFRHEDGTLAVSLASTDPDFARIAAQSAPPVLPVAESRSAENNSGQPGARGDSQSGAAAQHGGERRPAAEQRSDPEARFDQRPRGRSANEPAPTRDERRGGVFA